MKHKTHRHWPNGNLPEKGWLNFDFTTALGSLAVALLAYIVYHIYPLLSKGLLW